MRSRLVRLIGQALLSNTLEHCYISPTTKRCISRNRSVFPSINSFLSLQIAQFTGYPRSICYGTKEVWGDTIVKGEIINVHDLLFTNNRDYLVKYNNQQVKSKQLKGKVIALFFVPLFVDLSSSRSASLLLMELYNNLRSNNGFEVVFVAVKYVGRNRSRERDSHKHFLEMFSLMPWAAIPFSDIPSCKSLQRRFGFPETIGDDYSILIVDSMGMVLQCAYSEVIIKLYGASGYPFSDEKIRYLELEHNAVAMQPSLSTILASAQCDYVISNKREKVPIHTLDDKIVALFFYEPSANDDSYIECLKIAYKELAKNKINFEVVLIYLTDKPDNCNITNEESFWTKFKAMPWLAVPFKDPIHKKLKQIFEYLPQMNLEPCYSPGMVIFGPHGEFVEPLGMQVLDRFGIPAYPFTRAKVAKLETEKIKDLKLELLWDPNTVFSRKDGSQVPFSQLLGKRVILFFERKFLWYKDAYTKFLKMLIGMYLQTKGTHDEFEVIHVFESKIESAESKDIIGDVPWLVSLASELLPGDFGLYSMYGKYSYHSSILAFDRDGRVVRKTVDPTFETMEFPFCSHDLEEEALAQLNSQKLWFYWDCYPFGRRIHSARYKLLKVIF